MKTLLVEDDATSRQFLQGILEAMGHQVHSFATADEAWLAFQTDRFPLVLLDWRLPEGRMDGLDLCRTIRQHPSGRRSFILVVTVRTDPGDLEAALDAGADDYIPKPVSPDALKVRLRIAQARLDDASARWTAERALADSQSRLESVISNAPIVLFLLDQNGLFTFVRGRGLEALRLNPDELVGQSVFELSRGHPALVNHVSRALTGETFTEEVELAGVTLQSWYSPLPDGEGVMIVSTDITRRKTIERDLREEEERFRRFVEAAFEGIVLVAGRRIMDCNEQAAALFGYTAHRAIGRRASDFVHPRDHRRMMQFLREQRTDPFELTGRRRDGTPVQVEVRMRPLPYHGHQILVAALQDVTAKRRAQDEHRRLEEQLRQAQKIESLGVLAGGIAHDFNNLLMGVLGNASLAAMELPPNSPAKQHIQQIESAAQRAADLTNQMLAFSGKGKFVVTRINLSNLIHDMSGLLQNHVVDGVRLQYRLAEDLPEISGDPAQIRQILINLLSNASDAVGERTGVVRLSTGTRDMTREAMSHGQVAGEIVEGPQVYVEIRDAGAGMDEPTLARIFDPFFTTKFTGRGLGMAAVLGIIRGHRGAIRIVSQPGQGTTVTVMFPPATIDQEAPRRVVTADGPTAAHIGKPLVLVVDDEQTVLSVTSQMLERSGYEVITAASGHEAIERFSERAPDVSVVLLDLTMPDLNGDEVFAKIRQVDPSARVILMSGYSEQKAAAQFRTDGLAGFLQKPFTPALLKERVGSLMQDQTA
jgi:PAS domain S-box-containing protein